MSSFVAFVGAGAVAVVAGGLAAAVTGPTGWEHGSWVAAFLVLVTGVGQIGLGAGQALLADRPPGSRRLAGEVALLNAGSVLVIAGTLAAVPAVVTAGTLALAGALVMFAGTPRRHDPGHDGRRAWPRWAYTGLLAVLLVSSPIGLVLTWT